MLRVGLTGGIASGKSQVAARLSAAGVETLDLDRVGHETLAPGGSAHAPVLGEFGRGILASDGSIDRRKLASIVFADAAARERLNAIVHPWVRATELTRMAAAAARGAAVFVSDAALLVEAGGHLRYDRLVVAWCDPEEQVRRLRARDALDEAAARARLAAQMPVGEKRRFAHLEVTTGGSLDETRAQAEALARHLIELARTPRLPAAVSRAQAEQLLAAAPGLGPRGIAPVAFLEHVAERSHLEMAHVAQLLEPPAEGAWYRAAREDETGPGPEALAVPVALFCLVRQGRDPAFLGAAAASIARLTHRSEAIVAGAVAAAALAAEALQVAPSSSGPEPPEAVRRAVARLV